jgi:DNA-binding NarL/FixJ family response regulator
MPRTVLIADDNALIRKVLCKMFERESDYDLCAEACDGQQAVALAQLHKPELIVLDLSMPVMDGLAARKLKEVMPQIPIILFTQHEWPTVFTTAEASVDLIVSKSDGANLMNHIRSLIPV